jgi:hypothetical protein
MALGGAFAWGYYSEGISHCFAIFLAGPFWLAQKLFGNTILISVAGATTYFLFSFAVVSISRSRAALRKAKRTSTKKPA